MAEPITVAITGAAGQIAYSLLFSVAKGDVFGPNQPICLHLLDIEQMMGVLNGVAMELTDCALPLLTEVVCTADANVAFKNIDVAILVGAMPRREGMERKDLLKANVKIFKAQGQAIDTQAKKTVKVLVVGNPANTNAYICRKYAPSIPSENFSCLTRLDQNRAQSQVAVYLQEKHKVNVSCRNVYNVTIWGNHSSTQFPDITHAKVDLNSAEQPARAAVQDDNWVNNEFVKVVQTRGAAVIAARKLSSAMSAAKAICDHMRDWWFGTAEGRWVSMGVISDGSYGIEAGLMYSFPVKISADRSWSIVQGLELNEFAREKMDITKNELVEERDQALEVCQD